MRSYIIEKINYKDEYLKTAEIRDVNTNRNYVVTYMECAEWLEENDKSKITKEGDTLKGNVHIGFAFFKQKVNGNIKYEQNILKTSNILAVVEVSRVEDEYKIYAKSNIIEGEILIDFEEKADCKIGDKILIEGSLELEIEE